MVYRSSLQDGQDLAHGSLGEFSGPVCRRHWVVTTWMPGVAAPDPADGQPHPPKCPMRAQRLDGVLRARWMEAATPAHQRADTELVAANEEDEDAAEDHKTASIPTRQVVPSVESCTVIPASSNCLLRTSARAKSLRARACVRCSINCSTQAASMTSDVGKA